jgi:glycosyltransferase involved in cell wall biosynthesis
MDIFVMASRQDPFPLASLEAMAAGKALIVTNVGGLPEQVEHLESGIVVASEDVGAIASWIARLADEPELRARLGAAARRRAAEHFGLGQQVAGLDAAYREAMAIRGRA